MSVLRISEDSDKGISGLVGTCQGFCHGRIKVHPPSGAAACVNQGLQGVRQVFC